MSLDLCRNFDIFSGLGVGPRFDKLCDCMQSLLMAADVVVAPLRYY